LALSAALSACAGDAPTPGGELRRVPAEWEPHAATWMQWPGRWEAAMRPAFADIVQVVQAYEPVHMLIGAEADKTKAQALLAERGVEELDLTWHLVPTDNAWMRDNGPIWVEVEGELKILDFGFDAWGGNFGAGIPYKNDDVVPETVAELTGVSREDHGDYILERGNLEVNGAGIALINWDCQQDRNPGLTQTEHEARLTEALGLTQIVWAYGHDPADGTTGHIDGYARFIDADTVAIGETAWGKETEDALVTACEEAGLEVVRVPAKGDTDYMNWLVGEEFVLGMAFGDAEADGMAEEILGAGFPEHAVHMIDATSLWESGGGVHCVTNDQPASGTGAP
jgi:agmatine deiminase